MLLCVVFLFELKTMKNVMLDILKLIELDAKQ